MKVIIEAFLRKVAGIELGYECKECGKLAYLHHGVLKRTCEHTTTVVMSMEAHMHEHNLTSGG